MRRIQWVGGVTSTEYAALLSAVAVTVLASQGLLQRVIQAKIKLATDQIFAVSAADQTGNPIKQGEETQTQGIETHDPGSGLAGGNIIAVDDAKRAASYTETRTGGVSSTITRSGTMDDSNTTGVSIINDEQFVPPQFLRRPQAFNSLWSTKLPKGGTLPDAPGVQQPVGPPNPEPNNGGPAPAPTPGPNNGTRQ